MAGVGSQVKARDRASRRPVDRFDERRAELAAAALQTLAERGYARTSLREIALNSPYTHGVLHYYFADKVELITHCVTQYKAECVTRYDDIVASARTAEELRKGFARALGETLREDAAMHRLWYDLRNQSMFDEDYRDDVAAIDDSLQKMIWRVLAQYAALAGRELILTPSEAYGMLDGLFQQTLLRHLYGDELAVPAMQSTVGNLLPTLLRSE